jgi:TctA family transporter
LSEIALISPSGPQVFLAWDVLRYFIAFTMHIGCYSLLVLNIIFLHFWLTLQNKQKNELVGEVSHENSEGIVHGFEDFTDR